MASQNRQWQKGHKHEQICVFLATILARILSESPNSTTEINREIPVFILFHRVMSNPSQKSGVGMLVAWYSRQVALFFGDVSFTKQISI
jgi:hypothetical protein